MTTHFQATTSDGTVLRRSSRTKDYRFCVAALIKGRTQNNGWFCSWTSRYDLALAQRDQSSKSSNVIKVEIIPAEIITTTQATEIRKSKVTDADRYATKLAARVRKLGLSAKKHGDVVWGRFASAPATFDRDAFHALPVWGDQRREFTRAHGRQQRRNNRICKLIARKYLADNGIDLAATPALHIYADAFMVYR